MTFRKINIKPIYTSGRDNILRDFYIPTISESAKYDRAAGYFSSKLFTHITKGISSFFGSSSGSMRLIFGGELSQEDYETLNDADRNKYLINLSDEAISQAIDHMVSDIDARRLDLLALLVKTERLKIKFIYKKSGMYHDKFGIFTDNDNNKIVFQGSSNETASGYIHNIESITVFNELTTNASIYVEHFTNLFESLWNGTEPECFTTEVSNSTYKRLEDHIISQEIMSPKLEQALEDYNASLYNMALIPIDVTHNHPKIPSSYKGYEYALRPHQYATLEAWKKNNFTGIAELCTGAGKTVLAMHSIASLFKATKKLFVIIVVPYIALAEQWRDELKIFNIKSLNCWSGNAYRGELNDSIDKITRNVIDFECAIIVKATFQTTEMQDILSRLESDISYLIFDECHHLRNIIKSNDSIISPRFKLGLSATPFHYIDTFGNSKLLNYFSCSNSIYKYELNDALNDDVLTKYNYYPSIVTLEPDEISSYKDLTKKIAQAYQSDIDSEHLDYLLRERAMILATAKNKIKILSEQINSQHKQPLTLFYCGIDNDDGINARQIDEVCEILDRKKWNFSTYTSRESSNQRKQILNLFRDGDIDALVAMKCLDEGIDIPGCMNAYLLASSRDPRQFIQRRGRVLRKSPGKLLANIYDYIVVPPLSSDEYDESDFKMVQKEFERAIEFSSLAVNSLDAKIILLEHAKKFELTHLL